MRVNPSSRLGGVFPVKIVWKFEALSTSGEPVEMVIPHGHIVHAEIGIVNHELKQRIKVWAEIDTKDPCNNVWTFQVFRTGNQIPEDAVHFLTTYEGQFVRHLYGWVQ